MSKKEKSVVQNNETKAKPKKNRLAEVFMKDYRFEGLILLILAIVAIVLGVLILVGTLYEERQISKDDRVGVDLPRVLKDLSLMLFPYRKENF